MRTIAAVLGLSALLLAPGAAEAQVQVGPTVAYHDDFDFGLGATLNVDLPDLGERIGIMGDFIFFFPDADAIDYFEFNANLTYDLVVPDLSVRPFALAGLNVARTSVDFESPGLDSQSNTDLGINLGGGIAFDLGGFQPMVGLKVELEGGEGFVLFGTLPFDVSGN